MGRFVVLGAALRMAGSAVAADIPALPTNAEEKSKNRPTGEASGPALGWAKLAFVALALSAGAIPAIAADQVTKAAAAAPAPSPWSLIFDSEVRYSTWERTKGNLPGVPNQKGSQVYVPISAQAVGLPVSTLKLEFLLRGGYVSTTRSALPFAPFLGVPFSTGSVATATDTIFTGTATYLGWDGLQPFYSFNLNLPTGETVLRGLSGIARTDPDLVDVPAFGEGFNSGHTVGLNIPFTTVMMLTLSAGHTFRGEYKRDVADPTTLLGTNFALDRVRPGDLSTFGVNFAAAFDKLTVNLAGAATFTQTDHLNEIETFRNGKSYYGSASTSYKWDEMWTSTANASYTHTTRLFVASPVTGVLASEPFNSNSNILRASFIQSLAWRSFVFNGTVGYMRRYQNEYVPLAQAFVPAKTKWSAGGGLRYAAADNLSLSARAERFWIDEDAKPDFSFGLGAVNGLPMSYNGWLLAAGGTRTF